MNKTIVIDGVEGVWTPVSTEVNSPKTALEIAMDFIAAHEGFRSRAYRDPVGVWTIGYGHTSGVKQGDVISKDQALDLLKEDVDTFMAGVYTLTNVPLTSNQVAALTSFAYNLGLGAYSNSTLLRKLNNNKDYQGAADEFNRWVYAGGKVLPGLVTRRKQERDLFLS